MGARHGDDGGRALLAAFSVYATAAARSITSLTPVQMILDANRRGLAVHLVFDNTAGWVVSLVMDFLAREPSPFPGPVVP